MLRRRERPSRLMALAKLPCDRADDRRSRVCPWKRARCQACGAWNTEAERMATRAYLLLLLIAVVAAFTAQDACTARRDVYRRG